MAIPEILENCLSGKLPVRVESLEILNYLFLEAVYNYRFYSGFEKSVSVKPELALILEHSVDRHSAFQIIIAGDSGQRPVQLHPGLPELQI